MAYVEPRAVRPDEFLTAADLNQLCSGDIGQLYTGLAARIHRLTEATIGSGSYDPVTFEAKMFDRGLVNLDSDPSLVPITEEGLWLAGANIRIDAKAVGVTLLRIHKGDKPIAHYGCQPGHASDTRPLTWGVTYGYPGQAFDARPYQSTGDSRRLIIYRENVPDLWGMQLTGGRTKHVWTAPATWGGSDVITDAAFLAQLRENIRYLRSPPAVRAYESDSDQSATNNTWKTLTLDALSADPYLFWTNTLNDRLTIPETGIYLVGGCVNFANNGTGNRAGQIIGTSGPYAMNLGLASDPGHGSPCPLISLRKFTAGDIIQLQSFQNSGGSLLSTHSPEYAPVLWAVRMGTDQAAPTFDQKLFERLNALTAAELNTYLRDALSFLRSPPAWRMLRTATQSIPDGVWTAIDYSAADAFDTDSVHDAASGTLSVRQRATVARDGLYLIGGHTSFATSGAGYRGARLVKNGATVICEHYGVPGTAAFSTVVPTLTLVRLRAGDYITQEAFQSSGAPLNATPSGLLVDCWGIRVGV